MLIVNLQVLEPIHHNPQLRLLQLVYRQGFQHFQLLSRLPYLQITLTIKFTCSVPFTTCPKTTWRPFNHGHGTVVMKNWDLLKSILSLNKILPVCVWSSICHWKQSRFIMIYFKVFIFKSTSIYWFASSVFGQLWKVESFTHLPSLRVISPPCIINSGIILISINITHIFAHNTGGRCFLYNVMVLMTFQSLFRQYIVRESSQLFWEQYGRRVRIQFFLLVCQQLKFGRIHAWGFVYSWLLALILLAENQQIVTVGTIWSKLVPYEIKNFILNWKTFN